MKRKRKNPRTPEERAAQRERQRVLEQRVQALEAELQAAGSVYARIPREELLDFAIQRIESELEAKRKPT